MRNALSIVAPAIRPPGYCYVTGAFVVEVPCGIHRNHLLPSHTVTDICHGSWVIFSTILRMSRDRVLTDSSSKPLGRGRGVGGCAVYEMQQPGLPRGLAANASALPERLITPDDRQGRGMPPVAQAYSSSPGHWVLLKSRCPCLASSWPASSENRRQRFLI